MVIDELVRLLEDRDIGLWCKRAAWIVAIANTVVVAFQLVGLLVHAGEETTLPIALLTTLGGYVVTTAAYFFVLYALGAIATALVSSSGKSPRTGSRSRPNGGQ